MTASTIALTFSALFAVSCERAPDTNAKSPEFAVPPISMTVKQRSTSSVPGSGDALRLTIDDITRGQVMVSLLARDGTAVLAPVSLSRHGTARFKFKNAEYILRLTKLSNALIGEDHASFFIADPASDVVPEDAKVEQLLALLGNMDGAVFIRNGVEHSAKDAELHLRNKWILNETLTARKFIEDHATRSTESDAPYQIHLPDGTTVPTGEYLRKRLDEIERKR